MPSGLVALTALVAALAPPALGALGDARAVATANPAAARAAAAQGHEVKRAVVVVDLGNGEVRSACVRFRQQSITGIDLLRAARMDPVVQTYAGQGGAVCKLCGVGCGAGSGCLTCQAPNYWQYWRSDGGTGTYSYSQTGAGNTEVTDGDVEGWSWSGGEDPPPFLTVAEACSGPNVYDYEPSSSSAAATTTSTTSASSTTSRPSATTSTSLGAPGAPVPTTSPAVAVAPGRTAAGAPSTTTALPPPQPPPAGGPPELASRATPPASETPRSSLPALVAFGAVLAAVLGWTARLRRARRRQQ